jgi:hypothetical protein
LQERGLPRLARAHQDDGFARADPGFQELTKLAMNHGLKNLDFVP